MRQEDSSTVVLRSYRSGRLPNWYLEWLKDAMKYQSVEATILAVDASLLTTLHTDEA